MRKLLFATTSKHKASEVRAILSGAGIELFTLSDFPELPEPPETGETFCENALQKARFCYERTGLLCVADDSGIEVDALGGAPGVYSKRFSPEQTDEANNRLLLQKLTTATNRTARYRCAMALVGENGEQVAEGSCEGSIAHDERGSGGFGYDPLFLPTDYPGRTMAQVSDQEKNAISHRGHAFRQLARILRDM